MKLRLFSQSTNHSPAHNARRDPAPDARVGQLHQEPGYHHIDAVGPSGPVAREAEQAESRKRARDAATDRSAYVEIRPLAQNEDVRDREIALRGLLKDNLLSLLHAQSVILILHRLCAGNHALQTSFRCSAVNSYFLSYAITSSTEQSN